MKLNRKKFRTNTINQDNSFNSELHKNQKLNNNLKNYIANQDLYILKQNEKINIISAENKALTNTFEEYKNQFDILSKKCISAENRLHDAEKKLAQVYETMSYRLGYALIFGFKSMSGFKNLLKTINILVRERNIKRQKQYSSKVVEKKSGPSLNINYKPQKAVINWLLPNGFDFFQLNSIKLDDRLPIKLEKNGFTVDFTDYSNSYVVVKIDAASVNGIVDEKQFIMTMEYFASNDNKIKPGLDIPYSKALKKYYYYLSANHNFSDYLLLPIPSKVEHVELGIQLWDNKDEITISDFAYCAFDDGISIIIPAYKSEKTIELCIESLARQSLEFNKFEIIVVLNGEMDSTPFILKKLQNKYPQLDLNVFEISDIGAGYARNFGIKKASKGFTTFIDADDYVSSDFLINLYTKSSYTSLVLTTLSDVVNQQVQQSDIAKQLFKVKDVENATYSEVTSLLTMNACKLAPTYMIKSIAYDINLKSGEDVVYWTELLAKFSPIIRIADNIDNTVYYRVITDFSVSRQHESYDFNVLQRLQVIKQLCILLVDNKDNMLYTFVQSKINAQAGFIKRYLIKHRADYGKFSHDIKELKLENSFIQEVNALFSETLVISYCFAPYADTSGIVMSKRVNAMKKPVDIISNTMSNVRSTDLSLMKITNPYIGQHLELKAPQAFANWKAIEKFAELTVQNFGELISKRSPYEELYSRAMWPASNFAAALLKIKYPQMKWVAEFSDPLLMDVEGKQRYEPLVLDWLHQHNLVSDQDFKNDNLFYWCERLVYEYADEIIFTNTNQQEYMLSYAEDRFKNQIINKSNINPQPTLDNEYYDLSEIILNKEDNLVYMGYFGSFYVNRGFDALFTAWGTLAEKERSKLRLCIYTQQSPESILEKTPEALKPFILIQPYVEYFDFLALTKQFDILLVMDAETLGLKMNNPYLPSKISDYLGSGSKILALVEKDSPMTNIANNELISINLTDIYGISKLLNSYITCL